MKATSILQSNQTTEKNTAIYNYEDAIFSNAGTKDTALTDKPNGGIKVTIHIPENINERMQRQKINRIYDILTADT